MMPPLTHIHNQTQRHEHREEGYRETEMGIFADTNTKPPYWFQYMFESLGFIANPTSCNSIVTVLVLVLCVFIPSPVRVGTLLMEVPGTPIRASFFEFELKPTGKDSTDPTQHEIQHHIVGIHL